MNKHFKDIITHGALGHKIKVLRDLNTTPLNPVLHSEEHPEGQFKNVCAPIHIGWDNRLEKIVGVLGLSKREFIREAIQSAIIEADEIIKSIEIESSTQYVQGVITGIEEKDGEMFAIFEHHPAPETYELTEEEAASYKAGLASGEFTEDDVLDFADGKFSKHVDGVQ